MAVAFQARMTGGNSADGFSQQATGVTSISSTGMTVGAGATMLVAELVWGKAGTGNPATPACTWNGVSMTLQAIFGVTNGTDSDECALFTLNNPAAGNFSLACNWTNTADCYMSASSWTGSNGINATNTVQASGSTATITSATGNVTLAVMSGNGGAPTTNFNQLFVNAPFAPGGGASYQAGSASNAHTFTGTGATITCVCGIDIVASSTVPVGAPMTGRLIYVMP